MSNKEKALRQAHQLMTDIFAGVPINAEAIARLRDRPDGPHGHPLLAASQRLDTPEGMERLFGLTALKDGGLCTLWVPTDKRNFGLVVRIGDRSWHLRVAEPDTGCGGEFIGMSPDGEPVVSMRATDSVGPGRTVHVGDRSYPSTRCDDTGGFRWQLADDECLYRYEATRHQLYRFDAKTQTFAAHLLPKLPGPVCRLRAQSPQRVVVLYEEHREWYRCEVDALAGTVRGRQHQWRDDRLVTLEKRIRIFRADLSGRGWRILPETEEDAAKPIVGRLPYAGALTRLAEGRYAYISESDGDGRFWVIHHEKQPPFDHVTSLFKHGSRWRYWGLSQGHLWLMDTRYERPAPTPE